MKELFFILKEWSNLLLVIVGLSAFVIYYWQKRDHRCTAATLLKGQIDTIENRVALLKEDPHIGNESVYRSKSILQDNYWEKNKHLFLKQLSQSEVEQIQKFFDNAEQIERVRNDIIKTITMAWEYDSLAEHICVANVLIDNPNWNNLRVFERKYFNFSFQVTPPMPINVLMKHLDNFVNISGTTSYQKIQHISYDRR